MVSARIVGTAVLLLAFALPEARPVTQTEITRQVHVLATRDGKFVGDLTAADLEIEEGGKKAVIESVARSTVPLRVALIVADAGAGELQQATTRFVQPLLGKAEISIIAVVIRPDRIVDFTSDPAGLDKGIDQLGTKMTLRAEEGPRLLSAFLEAVRGIRKEGTRPVIVAMHLGADRVDGERHEELVNALVESGAVIYAVTNNTMSVRTGAPGGVRRGATPETGTTAMVIDDSTRYSGGIQVRVQLAAFAGVMQQIADELQRYHLVTYKLPPGAKTSNNLKVTSRTEGLKLRAPSRIPK